MRIVSTRRQCPAGLRCGLLSCASRALSLGAGRWRLRGLRCARTLRWRQSTFLPMRSHLRGKRDRYGRIVGKVWVQPESCPSCPMTLDAGHAQLTVGLAWWYRKYANEQSPQDRGAYEFSEQEARANRVGLWSEPDPIPPWEWRRRELAAGDPQRPVELSGVMRQVTERSGRYTSMKSGAIDTSNHAWTASSSLSICSSSASNALLSSSRARDCSSATRTSRSGCAEAS